MALAVISASVSPRVAAAPISALDRENARKLLNDGLDLRSAGKLDEALAKIKVADGLAGTPVTRLELGRTHMMLAQLVEARVAFVSVKDLEVDAKDVAKYAKARKEASELAAQILPRIPSLRVKLEGVPAGVTPTVTIDGVAIPPLALSEPRLVNPGKREVVATVSGRPEQRTKVDVVEGEIREITLVFPEVKPSEPVAPPGPVTTSTAASAGVAPPTVADAEGDRAGRTQKTIGLVVSGVGLVGVGVGVVLAMSASSRYTSATAGCNELGCSPAAAMDAESARSSGTTAFIVMGAGAALVVGGGVLFLTAPSSTTSRKPATTSVRKPELRFGVGPTGVVDVQESF